MLKFEGIAKVGEIIKAYDFAGYTDSYITGRVVDKGDVLHPATGALLYRGYTIEVMSDSGDKEDRYGDIGYVPFETSFDHDGRVELVLSLEELALLETELFVEEVH